MVLKRLGGLLAVAILAAAGFVGSQAVATPEANAAACDSWSRDLSEGMSGADVRELQIRLAAFDGRAGLAIDGKFGPATARAVKRFKKEYAIGTTSGTAGTRVFSKLRSLTSSDCTPIHFTYSELNRCNSTWSGGAVSAATAKSNARRLMWKLEHLRHALGNKPVRITSGFRTGGSGACSSTSYSRHRYGDAADLGNLNHSFCTIAVKAKSYGFYGILGPGVPDHNDHVHVSGINDGNATRRAPNCSGF
ncbi:peptidase M15 [Actinophytocola xinjiangensis]|uniref:Peptidase M15 n=1 Tax=Actinophytocola xinjiangensis TaxID=485602 RepID=A0A7Z0WFT9_9PSEU|nr:D-Ala-D-Ala carboxypeptidase family metallohydrolase [Actinophytocola xinjiangensis]OLF06210.1 peptidase M15 [Actinophytocola xinjiangensis]